MNCNILQNHPQREFNYAFENMHKIMSNEYEQTINSSYTAVAPV